MIVSIAAIEKAVESVRRMNIDPTRILMRPRAYREFIVATVPEDHRGQVKAMFLCGLPVVVTEDGLDGLEFAVSVIAPLIGPWADARQGAE